MSHLPTELHDIFVDHADTMRRLKGDGHFRALAERFGALDHEVRRIEAGDELASDAMLEDLKKHRLATLDEIAALLTQAEAA
jgi:uncharacterized protein YdcH (DUF465 family)